MSLKGKRLGSEGEAAAAGFLKSRGYAILETNYRTRAFEIDIIASHGSTLCFIEVKTRRHRGYGLPREAVTRAKQQKLRLGAAYYLKEKGLKNHRARFDVVEVMACDDGSLEFTLIPNAFSGD